MENVKVVGLTGRAGSGKDLVGAMMRLYDFERLAFADGVRQEVAMAIRRRGELPAEIRMDREDIEGMWHLWDPEQVWEKPTGPLMRSLLQQWGTEYRREQEPDYWITRLQARLSRIAAAKVSPRIVITDVRFPNEARWIREAGGEVWRIDRPGIGQDSHISERPLPDELVTRTIKNSGDQYLLAELIYDAARQSQVMV